MDMPLQAIIFYAFSAVMVLAAIMVITVRNPVYAALFLVLAFLGLCGPAIFGRLARRGR